MMEVRSNGRAQRTHVVQHVPPKDSLARKGHERVMMEVSADGNIEQHLVRNIDEDAGGAKLPQDGKIYFSRDGTLQSDSVQKTSEHADDSKNFGRYSEKARFSWDAQRQCVVFL